MEWLKRIFSRQASSLSEEELSALSWLPFPYDVVSGREALSTRDALRSESGITPVLMGEPDDLRLMGDILADAVPDPRAIIEQARALDVPQWFAQRVEADPEYYSEASGEWPTGRVQQIELSLHRQVLSGLHKSRVLIGRVPTPHAYEVPAFVGYGGWNECPEAQVHVALHARWHSQFGSEITCLSSDVIECTVSRPPATREEALKLAREQYIYCPDIVQQGVETIENLAASLMASRAWYFWWD